MFEPIFRSELATFGSHERELRITIKRATSRAANWIVSYPRSGNSLVRTLIANYFSGLDRAMRLDEIIATTVGENAESLWQELTGKLPADRSLDEQWGMRLPYIERLRGRTSPAMPLIKSHTIFADVAGRPAFKFIHGDRIIHVVRHPGDVAISCAHFYNVSLDEAIDRLLTPGFYIYGPPDLGYEVMGSWSQHTRCWMQLNGVPALRVHYEDMVARPIDVLSRIVEFLGHVPDNERVGLAVEFSNFDRLRLEERCNGFNEASTLSSQPYFREGRAGQWLDGLSGKQAGKLLDSDAELLSSLNYQGSPAALAHTRGACTG